MEILPFVAPTAAEAFARIQNEMGPEAVVLNVRQLPISGISRLWRKPHVEVLACPPGLFESRTEDSADAQSPTEAIPSPALNSGGISNAFATAPISAPSPSDPLPSELDNASPLTSAGTSFSHRTSRWRVARLLESGGLTPLVADRVIDDIEIQCGKLPPASLGEEIAILKNALRLQWTVSDPIQIHRPQMLIGPSGSGKTTLLCKWLTKAVLMDGQQTQVYRLDGTRANTAELLDVHGEILGVKVHRSWSTDGNSALETLKLVDLPGVDWRDRQAIGDLRRSLDKISGAEVHLVLNGAYEVNVLLAQIRAFSILPISSLMITHLDEETRWSKLWNLVLGCPLPVRFLSAGQNIPGEFLEANPGRLSDRWLGLQ